MDAKFVFFLILVLSVCVNSRNEGISHKYLEKKTLTFSFKCCTNHLPTVCQLIFMQDWSFLLITLHYLNSEFNKYSITSLHCDTLLGKDSKHLKFVVSKMKLWHTSSTNRFTKPLWHCELTDSVHHYWAKCVKSQSCVCVWPSVFAFYK